MGSQPLSILRGRHKPICSFKRPFICLPHCMWKWITRRWNKKKTPVWCHYCSLCKKWWCMGWDHGEAKMEKRGTHSRYTLEIRLESLTNGLKEDGEVEGKGQITKDSWVSGFEWWCAIYLGENKERTGISQNGRDGD